jgi:Cu2+-exporting ATPase
LLALVRDNPHPVSQCLLENLLASGGGNALRGDVQETVGIGVQLDGWSLGRAGWRDCGGQGTVFARHGKVIASFSFVDSARPDARSELAALAGRGFATFILSGDRQEKVNTLASELGLARDHVFGGLTPQEKAKWLEENDATDALMLGDGVNDSLAFDQARCRGTPVIHRGVLERKADFYYLGRGIAGIRGLFEVDVIRRRTQVAVLVFSIVYNLLAVGLAVAGKMNPLLAAALMPINSLLTLTIVGWGMRATGFGGR